MGPGGADADRNESDVGRGGEEDLKVADQPLSAQQSGEDVPDEVQQPEDIDEDGDQMQDSSSDPKTDKSD